MFISFLLLSLLILSNPPQALYSTLNIFPNISSKAAINVDFKSRLNQAEKDLEKSKAGILKEVEVSEKDFNNFIKKNSNFYQDCFKQKIIKYKNSNKCLKLVNMADEICVELQKNPKIEILAIDNLFGKCSSPGITIGQTIFVDSKFVDNPGIIMHEICHAINDDQITICALDALIDQHNKNTKNSKFNRLANLRSKFYQRLEKKADLWSAAHGKDCAKQLADFFKSLGCASTECHPDLAERIAYLS